MERNCAIYITRYTNFKLLFINNDFLLISQSFKKFKFSVRTIVASLV